MAIVDSLLETSIIAHSPHPILVEAKVVLVAIAAHDQEVLEAVALHICACEGLRNRNRTQTCFNERTLALLLTSCLT